MRVQASRDHYCTPREDNGPYTHVEVTYPSEWEDLLIPYRDTSEPAMCGTRPILHTKVSAQTVCEVVARHGGMTYGSGKLPQMVEVDEDGYQWAAAAEVPSSYLDDDSMNDDADDEEEGERSPYSAVHMGAPPPLPPPPRLESDAAAAGALTPPPTLVQTTMSPIETHEKFVIEDFE